MLSNQPGVLSNEAQHVNTKGYTLPLTVTNEDYVQIDDNDVEALHSLTDLQKTHPAQLNTWFCFLPLVKCASG